jgi:hypothetical protein
LFAQFGIEYALLQLGLGRHIQTLSPTNSLMTLKLIYIVYFMYDAAICTARASALLFFSRIFPRQVNTTLFNVMLWALHAFNVAWFIGIMFGTIFLCQPVSKNWNPAVPGACGPTTALWIGSAVPSVSIDLGILILPIPKIWGLQISLARKTGIATVFLLGYW